jgi:uncharacterized protein Yka (UPF0111/DUF47 family)
MTKNIDLSEMSISDLYSAYMFVKDYHSRLSKAYVSLACDMAENHNVEELNNKLNEAENKIKELEDELNNRIYKRETNWTIEGQKPEDVLSNLGGKEQ